ncbi:MAG: hypothetical protein LH468_05975 [Nocardioides sp.]|nr:hypothetical protein [Nocardioides sp.]
MPGAVVVVLVVAAGAGWESQALALMGRHQGIVVLKRCVDVDDLMATAAAGQADVAVLGLDSHGLDVAAVDHLRTQGVRPVAIAPASAGLEAARLRAARIGIHAVVAEADLVSLPDQVLAADPDPGTAGPRPRVEGATDEVGTLTGRTPGRVIVVWGPAGAPGRTTVAVGLAAELCRRGLRTILVDADPHGGTVAQTLGVLDEVSGVLVAARLAVSGELAERFSTVQRALDARLTVITGLPRADRWVEVRAGTVEAVLEQARTHGHVVVDTGFSVEQDPAADVGSRPGRNQMTVAALESADEVVVVGSADPVGLSRLARALVDLRELGTDAPVRVVVNRMRPSLGWSQRDVAAMLGGFADPSGLHFLPEDRVSVDRALVTGRTLSETAPDAPLTRALVTVADSLVGDTGAPAGRSRRALGARGGRPRAAGRARRR